MARDNKYSPLLTVGEVAHFLNAQADAVRCWGQLSAAHSYRIESTGWLTVHIWREKEPGRSFALPIARVGGGRKRLNF